MSQITHFCGVKLLAWKSGCVNFFYKYHVCHWPLAAILFLFLLLNPRSSCPQTLPAVFLSLSILFRNFTVRLLGHLGCNRVIKDHRWRSKKRCWPSIKNTGTVWNWSAASWLCGRLFDQLVSGLDYRTRIGRRRKTKSSDCFILLSQPIHQHWLFSRLFISPSFT